MGKGLKVLQSAARVRRATISPCLNSQQDQNDDFDDFRDSGICFDGPPSDAGLPVKCSTDEALSPDTTFELQSTSAKLDKASSGLDQDLDLLQPSYWIAEHQKIQLYALECSFWFESNDEPRSVFDDRYMLRPGARIKETYYVQYKLPTKCPVRQLKSSWQEFINTDTILSCATSGSLSVGIQSRESEGTIQDCIHAFQSWLSRHGSVLDNAITAVSSRSTMQSDISTHITSLIKSRNILITLCQTVEYLQRERLCIYEINMFVEDRPKVIRLVSIPLERFGTLTKRLNLIVGSLSWAELYGGFDVLMIRDPGSFVASLSHHSLISILEKGDLESLSDYSSVGTLAACWQYLARVLDLAVITYCSSHLVSTPEESSLLHQLNPGNAIGIRASESFFAPASLGCLNGFIQGGGIWTLCYEGGPAEVGMTQNGDDINSAFTSSTPFSGISSAYVSASIESVADIWGPVWRLEKTQTLSSGTEGWFYALGSGAIGEMPRANASSPITILSDEVLCHFVPSRDEMEYALKPIYESSPPRLLIGITQTGGLVLNESCQTPRQECIQGVDLRPHGTSSAIKYSSATTFSLGIGYSGTQIGVSKQYQRYPLVTRKQSLVQKWTVWPNQRNPFTVLLWWGIEVSVCTRNARRRRLIHILGSSTMAPFVDMIRWESLDCGRAFKQSLTADNIDSFPRLYTEHVEWRTELGQAVAYLLSALANTGIVRSGDLEVYTHTDSKDPDQILTIPSKIHTWVGLLKDTERSATFAVTTSDCLSFPYGELKYSGQRCRGKRFTRPQHTVFETTVAPVSSPYAPTSAEKTLWSQGIPPGGRLPMLSAKTDMLKVVDYLPNGELLATWSACEFFKAALLGLPSGTTSTRYQERADDSTYELLTGVKIYVISERGSLLQVIPKKRRNRSTELSLPQLNGSGTFNQPPLSMLNQ